MARVYLAESAGSSMLRKLVVLKVLNQELAVDPEMRRSFIREAEISARLNHPNIVNVMEVFEQGASAVMVMQHLEGMTLSEIMSRRKGSIPLKLHINVIIQVLDALHYFHELKDSNGKSLETVHRDVSPENVMVLHEGGVKVVDFGVAKVRVDSDNHTHAGVIKGKIAYMPPEQLLSSANVDRRADIYSVGVMLWEAVAGRRMWRGMEAAARMRAIIKGEIPDIRQAVPSVSDALAKIIERALAHSPEGRYATAEEMQIDLEQVALTEGGHTGPRELAEFMRANFDDERREKQREIERLASDREYSLATPSFTFSESPGVANERSSVQAAQAASSVVVSVQTSRWRRPVVGGVLLVALGGVIATVALSGRTEPHASAVQPAKASPAPVTLRVDSDQVGAEVFLNGVKLGETPFVQTRNAATGSAHLELRASGRVIESKVVSLQDDVAVHFTTRSDAQRPTHAGDIAEPEENAQNAELRDSDTETPGVVVQANEHERRQGPARQRRSLPRAAEPARDKAPASATAPAAPAAAKASSPDSCDPPYRIDPGGVKVFKPHCF